MPWHHVVACFLGSVFLANFFPHFIAGMSGARFYTPFAKPPFRGLSSPVVNMLYALLNLALAYVLLVIVGSLELRDLPHAAVSAAGFGLASVLIARSVTKLKASSPSPTAPGRNDGAGNRERSAQESNLEPLG